MLIYHMAPKIFGRDVIRKNYSNSEETRLKQEAECNISKGQHPLNLCFARLKCVTRSHFKSDTLLMILIAWKFLFLLMLMMLPRHKNEGASSVKVWQKSQRDDDPNDNTETGRLKNKSISNRAWIQKSKCRQKRIPVRGDARKQHQETSKATN